MPVPISVELAERFLRPQDLKQKHLESSWSDEQRLWMKDKQYGFILVKAIEKVNDDKTKIELPDRSIECVKDNLLSAVNAARFDRSEDIADMAELNEATVYHNLKQRYDSNLIYTYSGLFLVAINPYKLFPIFGEETMKFYRNQTRSERPPHVFSVADAAYRALIESHKNQSILITGESGAGKTENTKRVIQYLANIAGGGNNLEHQIIRANPILEAFGNAQTVRNNNSSRFGKFVRIEFNHAAGNIICGGNIEHYLLEKSRVTHRDPKERSFHVFYQLLKGASSELKAKIMLDGFTVKDFVYLNSSNTDVNGMDDVDEFQHLLDSMLVLGFSDAEQESYFKGLSAVLHLGNLEFDESSDGQAILKNPEVATMVSQCLGVSTEAFIQSLLNPVIKAGRDDIVTQNRDVSQALFSVEALARSLYERIFSKLVARINQSINILQSTSSKIKSSFIGVLDIAGFEIFEKNSFEQLLINHTNERLQQFFNHRMFIIEQEEYRKEGIEWNFIDFGLDLQPTIDLIEKGNPIGLLPCLDEDCVVPKATDKSFLEKITQIWKGKFGKFESLRFGEGFAVNHYAGRVEYGVDGWLVKNKDPLNEDVTRLLANSSHQFISNLFADYAGNEDTAYATSKGLVKRGIFRTVSQKHRESLNLLMQQLYSTQPHFVRCIVPNKEKRVALLEPPLILEQLRCNGVLEGIRICRLGYPNRLLFADFRRLYEILVDSNNLPSENKDAVRDIVNKLGLKENESFKMGHSKIFFRVGEVSKLDEMRDRRLAQVLRTFQSFYRLVLAKRQRNYQQRAQESIIFLQRNMREYLKLRTWPWWRLFSQIRPLLNVTRAENRIEELEEELEKLSLDRNQQMNQLRVELETERNRLIQLESTRRDLERENQQLMLQLEELTEAKTALLDRKLINEAEIARLKERITSELESQKDQMQSKLIQLEKELVENRSLLSEQRTAYNLLKAKLDDVEFEKLKMEKSDVSSRNRATELEGLLEEARRGKKDLEAKLRKVEEAKRAIQEQLDDAATDETRLKEAQLVYENQLRTVRQQLEAELQQREDEFDQTRKKLQREIHQLNFDLEEERKQTSSLKEAVKRYESGADNLANQLEAEMRQQNSWKREKERLEQRLKEMTRQNQESFGREDILQVQISNLNEQLREFRSKFSDVEEALAVSDRQRKAAESRYETALESQKEVLNAKAAMEKSLTTTQVQLDDVTLRLHEEQDNNIVHTERIRVCEQMLKLTQAELEEEKRNGERFCQEKAVLEMQIKELQVKMLEMDGSTGVNSRSSRRPIMNATYQQIMAQMESESQEKAQLLKDLRRYERQVRDLQSQIGDKDRDHISLEESLDKYEIRLRKAQTALEASETASSEVEAHRRRLERDLHEEREKSERLSRECDRLKTKLQFTRSASEQQLNL